MISLFSRKSQLEFDLPTTVYRFTVRRLSTFWKWNHNFSR